MSDSSPLLSYLPRSVTGAARQDPRVGTVPVSERQGAAVLYADISGFTRLARELAEAGPSGAEQLSRHLNACLNGLLQAIRLWGGDVVKFAGDALLASWPHSHHASPTEAAFCAAAAALAGQHNVRALRESGEHPLEVRIGVANGSLHHMFLGGAGDQWETFFGGSAVHGAVAAESRALNGAVVLERQAWTALVDVAEGLPMGADYYQLSSLPAQQPPGPRPDDEAGPLDQRLVGFLSDVVRHRFQASNLVWIGELRRVHVGFVHLPGLTADTPLGKAQQLVSTVRTVLRRFHGALNKLSVDDKGAALLFAFGLPGHAHEDDAVRAAQAAWEIRRELADIAMDCAIGVAGGWVFCGTVGNNWRREYTVLGPAVNLASRLTQSADKAVLCDGETAARLPPFVVTESAGRTRFKGLDQPVDVVRILRLEQPQAAAREEHFVLVDRVAERARIQDFLASAGREQPPHVLLLEGEAGIGKTRLVNELLRRARSQEFVPLFGAGEPIDRGRLYHAWRSILVPLLALDRAAADPVASLNAWVERRVPHMTRFVPLLAEAVGFEMEESDLTASLSAEVRAHNTRRLIVEVVRAALGRKQAVVVLEDAAWMDSASWETALEVARSLGNVLVVVSTRPLEEDSPGGRVLAGLDSIIRINVGPIPADDVLELVSLHLGVRRVPGALARLVQERSQGNPLFVEELANALLDVGVLTVTDGSCHLASHWVDLDESELPATVNGILQARLDRLAPELLQALKVAAVLGKRFSGTMVADLFPVPASAETVGEFLRELVNVGILQRGEGSADDQYTFRHGLLRDAVYQTLLLKQRRELHQAAAQWYETRRASHLEAHLAIVAHHWRKGGNADRALHYLDLAGRKAARSYANDEAVHLLSRALELVYEASRRPSRQTLADWHNHLGEAHLGLGNLEASREHFLQALAFLNLGPPRTRLGLLFQTLRLVLQADLTRRRTPRLQRARQADERRIQAARIYSRIAQLGVHDNDRLTALNAGLRSMTLATGTVTTQHAQSLAWGAAAAATMGRTTFSRAFGQRALDVLETLDDPETAAAVHFVLGTVALAFARWTEAIHHLATGRNQAERIGDQRRAAECRTVEIFAHHCAGDFLQVSTHLEELQHVTWQSNDAHYHLVSSLGYARLAVDLSDPGAARAHIEAARSLLDSASVMNATRATVHAVRARVLLDSSPRQSVLECWELSARGLLASRPINPTVIWGYDALGVVGLALARDMESFGPRFRFYLKRLKQFGRSFPLARPLVALIQGQEALLAGRTVRARRLFSGGVELARELEAPLYEARLLEQLARCCPEHSEELTRRANDARSKLKSPRP